jgi:hypothetical protein
VVLPGNSSVQITHFAEVIALFKSEIYRGNFGWENHKKKVNSTYTIKNVCVASIVVG